MNRVVLCLLCLIPFLTPCAHAKQPPEFKEAYKAYTERLEQGKVREAIPYAEKALDIALTSDAFNDEARGKLAFNLGYVNFQDDRMSAAVKAFTQAIDLFERAGVKDLQAEALVYRGVAYRHLLKIDKAKTDLKKAITYLDSSNVAVQMVRAEALENLAWVYVMDDDATDAQKCATEAYELYSRHLTDRHPRTINAMIAVSASAWLNTRRGEARNMLARAIDMAEKAGVKSEDSGKAEPGQFTLLQLIRFHRDVALLYELMGRRSDARYHRNLVEDLRKGIPPAISRVKPLDRSPPSYPRRAAQRGAVGWVIVEFDVLKDGSTTNIRVVDSAPEGFFEDACINAVKNWKYEPPREDGKPVDVPGVRTVIKFMLEN